MQFLCLGQLLITGAGSTSSDDSIHGIQNQTGSLGGVTIGARRGLFLRHNPPGLFLVGGGVEVASFLIVINAEGIACPNPFHGRVAISLSVWLRSGLLPALD
jgi:hypothetical protein